MGKIASGKNQNNNFPVEIVFPEISGQPGTVASATFKLKPEAKNGAPWKFKCTSINGKEEKINANEGIKILFSKVTSVAQAQVCMLTITLKSDDDGDDGVWQFDQTMGGGRILFGIEYCSGGDCDVEDTINTSLSRDKRTLTLTLNYPCESAPIGILKVANFAFTAKLTKGGSSTRFVSEDPKIGDGDHQ